MSETSFGFVNESVAVVVVVFRFLSFLFIPMLHTVRPSRLRFRDCNEHYPMCKFWSPSVFVSNLLNIKTNYFAP